jgi:hypothetical protein
MYFICRLSLASKCYIFPIPPLYLAYPKSDSNDLVSHFYYKRQCFDLSGLSDDERYHCFLQSYMQTTDDDTTNFIQIHYDSSSISQSIFYAPHCDIQTETFTNH